MIGSIFINNDDANKNIDETADKAESASSKLNKAFGVIAKGVVAGVGACATAIGVVGKQSLEAYADYEQLVGGIETLLGTRGAKTVEEYAEMVGQSVEYVSAEFEMLQKSQELAMNNASDAYKTAGLSMNEYMDTVTSFVASLKQSTASELEATELANMAVIDMADNANKMGTAMESIQVAYAGFAKQNYSMLDNLKLGYGGTQAEMYRLMSDAKALDETFDAVFSLDSKGHLEADFADIVKAINIVQTSMGITGTTALEAEKTISGSLATLKSAWKNTLVAMADDEADFSASIDALVTSATTVISNVLPRIQIIAQAIPTLINQLAPQIPAIVQSLFPALLEGALGLFNGLVSQIPALIGILMTAVSSQAPTLFATVGNLLVGLANYIQTNLPIITEKARDMVSGLGQKIKENLPELISKGLDILLGLSESILTNVPMLIATGMDMIMSIVEGIIGALPELIAKAPVIIANFANTINESMPIILSKGIDIIMSLIQGIVQSIPDIIANIGNIIKAIFAVWDAINWMNLGKNLMNGIKNGITNLKSALSGSVTDVFTNLKNIGSKIFNAMKTDITSIFNGIKNAITNPIQTAKDIFSSAISAMKNLLNFTWSLPKLKMPHFTISGKFSLNPPSVPKFGISWYKKAMDNPMMFTRPTIFDVNPITGQARGAGEAGDEVMMGKDTMLNLIQEAVARETSVMMGSVDDVLNRIFDLLSEYVPEMAHMQMVMDTGVMVGELAPAMDTALGAVYKKRKRGV